VGAAVRTDVGKEKTAEERAEVRTEVKAEVGEI
jgi:hypothetical protein